MRGRGLVETSSSRLKGVIKRRGLVETCSRRLRQVNMRGGGLVET